jgi:hypothetical protein
MCDLVMVQTRIPNDLAHKIEKLVNAHEKQLLAHDPNDDENHAPEFPGEEIADLITQAISVRLLEFAVVGGNNLGIPCVVSHVPCLSAHRLPPHSQCTRR